MKLIERPLLKTLEKRLKGPLPYLQAVVGPRQVGKTTLVRQLENQWQGPSWYASADLPSPPDASWIQSQWEIARREASQKKRKTLLVLDEIQKIPRWEEAVKAHYDQDRRNREKVRAVLLGSASLHVQKGAQESLAGRFELHFCPHWSWPECREAFNWNLDQWIYFGGYPGAAPLIGSQERWRQYVSESLVESVLSRDVLQLTPVVKPALLRRLFMLAVRSPAQIFSYNKMLGQLQDAGNTVTLAHYTHLLSSAYLLSGLNLWSGSVIRQRASSPKFVIWNNALINAMPGAGFQESRRQTDFWGRLVENAVGAYLLNQLPLSTLYYWRKEDAEVDYVVERGREVTAIEVKRGRLRSTKGLELFRKLYPRSKTIIVGSGGIPLEKFFSTHPTAWF